MRKFHILIIILIVITLTGCNPHTHTSLLLIDLTASIPQSSKRLEKIFVRNLIRRSSSGVFYLVPISSQGTEVNNHTFRINLGMREWNQNQMIHTKNIKIARTKGLNLIDKFFGTDFHKREGTDLIGTINNSVDGLHSIQRIYLISDLIQQTADLDFSENLAPPRRIEILHYLKTRGEIPSLRGVDVQILQIGAGELSAHHLEQIHHFWEEFFKLAHVHHLEFTFISKS